MKKIILILALVLLLAGCSSNGGPSNGDENGATLVRVGIVGSESKSWNHIKEVLREENIDVELIFFDGYPLPNAALAAGEIELNAFQHYDYLNKEIEQFGYDLTVIGETYLAPLGIYSKQIESLDELEDGSTIVIPDDVTNGGRALMLLQANGLITVDPAAGATPALKDIENPRNFNILELAAANIPASLEEVPVAVINSGIATDAGFIPAQDAIVLEEAVVGENPYINVIVARTEDQDNAAYKRIVEVYHTDETKAIIDEDSKGSLIPVW